MRFIVLLISFVVVGGLIEWYIHSALSNRWDHWSPWLKNLSKYAFWTSLIVMIVSIIMLFALGNYFNRATLNFWFSFLLVNFIVKTSLAVFVLFDDIRRLIVLGKNKLGSEEVVESVTRSDFLLKAGIAVAAVPLISLGWGMIAGPYRYKVFNEKVILPNLPSNFNGLRIAQISDIHAGSFYNKEAVERGVQLLLDQKPDIVLFTGDIVNDRAEEMGPYLEIFKRIQAPLGVYSILGNHDYGDYVRWESEEEKEANNIRIREIHKNLGWRLLLNEHVYLEKDCQQIALIGVENWGKGFHQVGDLKKAYKGCNAPVKLLLSHDPTHFEEVVKKDFANIDITFSGHTHGAQMGIETGGFKWSPISLRYKKWAGLYEENGQYLYINRGFGFIGYAGRLGIMPEITVIELTT